jgi:hypothetical protein
MDILPASQFTLRPTYRGLKSMSNAGFGAVVIRGALDLELTTELSYYARMWKMKFAVLLPISQLALDFAFWEWPFPTSMPTGMDARFISTPMLVGYGISAPAILTKLLVVPFRGQHDFLPFWIGRFNIEDLIFFVGALVLWHLIGRALDHRISSGVPVSKGIGVGKALWNFALEALGVFLFGAGLQGIFIPSARASVGLLTNAILLMIWGLALIIIPGIKLLKAIRRLYPQAGSQTEIRATDGRPFPFSKPIMFLIALAAIYTAGLCVLALHEVIPPLGQSRILWGILFGLILTWWVYADRGKRKFRLPYEFEYFVLFAWPVVVPYYLHRRLGRRGLFFGFGIWGLYFVPYVVSAIVYTAEQIHSYR